MKVDELTWIVSGTSAKDGGTTKNEWRRQQQTAAIIIRIILMELGQHNLKDESFRRSI